MAGSIVAAAGVGRPRKLSIDDEQALADIAEEEPFGTARTYSEKLLEKTKKRICGRTVLRYLKTRNVRFRRATKKPLLTTRHRKLRVA